MSMENMQPDELLELSTQELDDIAGGAASAAEASNEKLTDAQFTFTVLPKDGGIINITKQETFFSEQDLKEFQDSGIPI